MPLFDWIGNQFGSLFGSTSPGAPGSSVYGPPGSAAPSALGGLLDPQAIRQQAAWQGLGALSQGLLAAGLRHPAAQGSLIPQALAGFQPAYNAGIQSGGQMAALEQQAIDQQRMEQLRRSDPRYANLPTQALIAQASRPQSRPMTAAESMTNFGSVIPGAYFDGTSSAPSLPRGPLQEGLTTDAQTRARVGVEGVDLGFTGQRGYPNMSPPGGAAVPPTAATPPVAGGAQRPPVRTFTADDFSGMSPADAQAAADRANEQARIGSDLSARNRIPVPPPVDRVPPTGGRAQTAPTPAPTQTAQAPATTPPVRSTDPQMRTVPNYGRVFGTDPAALRRAQGTAETQDAYTRATIIPQINNGVQTVEVVRRMREQAADPNMQFGPGAGARNTAAEFLRSWGGESGAALATRIQSTGFSGLESLSAQQVLASLGGSLGTGISNTDVAFINRTVPNPFQSRETFMRFVDLVESRALNNIHTAHNAYRSTVPDWSAERDPISAHMIERLEALGVDTAPLLAQRQRGATPPATSPPPTRAPQIGDTATNPQTGAQVRWDGIRWVPVQATR